MRIVLVSRYFWPETMLENDICRWLVKAGYNVEVLCGQPDYIPEVGRDKAPLLEDFDGVLIRRYSPFRVSGRGWQRNLNTILFVLHAVWRVLFGPKISIVWSSSIPPIVQPFLLRIASRIRGARYLYYLQDIYPDIACVAGILKPGLISQVLLKIEKWSLSTSDAVVTLSSDMADVVGTRGVHSSKLYIIRSFSLQAVNECCQPRSRKSCFEFVYAGNIGRFQNLEALIRVFERIDEKFAVLTLLGDGREKKRLQAIVDERKIRSVRFRDFMPINDAATFIAQCDVGIVALQPSIYRYAFPIKFYTYLGAGVPILALVENESELSRIVHQREIGETAAWEKGDDAIEGAVHRIISKYDRYRENVLANTEDLHGSQIARDRWLKLFGELAAR